MNPKYFHLKNQPRQLNIPKSAYDPEVDAGTPYFGQHNSTLYKAEKGSGGGGGGDCDCKEKIESLSAEISSLRLELSAHCVSAAQTVSALIEAQSEISSLSTDFYNYQVASTSDINDLRDELHRCCTEANSKIYILKQIVRYLLKFHMGELNPIRIGDELSDVNLIQDPYHMLDARQTLNDIADAIDNSSDGVVDPERIGGVYSLTDLKNKYDEIAIVLNMLAGMQDIETISEEIYTLKDVKEAINEALSILKQGT